MYSAAAFISGFLHWNLGLFFHQKIPQPEPLYFDPFLSLPFVLLLSLSPTFPRDRSKNASRVASHADWNIILPRGTSNTRLPAEVPTHFASFSPLPPPLSAWPGDTLLASTLL